MQTAREYAVSLGLAKPGRGRLSREAKAALNDALSKGTKFSDYPKGNIVVSTDTGEKTIAAAKPDFVNAAEPIYPKNLKIYALDGTKRIPVNNRECCHDCGYSFRWCACNPGRYLVEWDRPCPVSKEY